MATQPSDPRPARPPSAGIPREQALPDPAARALLLWPGLDRARLAETKGDPRRIARLVSRRTNLPPEAILRMLGVRADVEPGRRTGRRDSEPDPS
jgi:hypothetical protein